MEIVNDKNKDGRVLKMNSNFWEDALVQDYYQEYYQNLSSQKLDREFLDGLQTLAMILGNLPGSERNKVTEILADYIELYLENKIEKEIDDSFLNILSSK